MSAEIAVAYSAVSQQLSRLIWRVPLWPPRDCQLWVQACNGEGPDGMENPAVGWCDRTLKKNEDGYGRYLSWLHRQGLLIEQETISERLTPDRIASFIVSLKAHLSPVSVAMTVGAVNAAARAFAPNVDWSWLSRRFSRLKARAKPSRDKRCAIQHTLDLYNYGKDLMHTADDSPGAIRAAQRFQAGLAIALLAARPLRIRNFRAITIGESLRWDGKLYWLTFSRDETKTDASIDEPCPADLTPYLDTFLKVGRPVLLRKATKHANDPTHRRLWVDHFGKPMREATLRELIERYTRARFGVAIWPHLFRDCLLTSVAIDRPDLMHISASLLGHTNIRTGEKHYNQAQMLDASRRYGTAILELRESFLDALRDQGPMGSEATRQPLRSGRLSAEPAAG